MEEIMKKLLRLIYAVICSILVLFLAACSSAEEHPEFLTEHEWTHFTYCDETISFGDDGSYAYYCACGSPVGDSDLYETYKYDPDTSDITLSPKGSDSSIKVLRYEKSRLLLKFSDGVKEFYDAGDPLASNVHPDMDYDPDNYIQDFSSYLTIISRNGDSVTTAPAGYDADYPEYDEYLLDEKLAENAMFYEWNLTITVTDEGEQPDSSYRKLSAQQVERLLDGGPAAGYVWYNADAEIEKILFYGKTIIE